MPLVPTLLVLALFAGVHLRYLQIQRAENSFYLFSRQVGRGEFAEAQGNIENAIRLTPNNAHYLSNAALLHARMSLPDFDFAGYRKPQLAQEETANLTRAAEYYRQVLELNRYDDHACHNLGWIYWLMQQPEEALLYLRRAVSLDESMPLYHISLGILYEYGDRRQDAYGEYARAIRLSPGVTESRFFREFRERFRTQADALVDEVITSLEDEVRRGAGPIVKARLGKLQLDRHPDRAADLLREATLGLSNLSRPWTNLGLWYEQRADFEQARRSYRKALFIDSNDVTAIVGLARYYEQRQQEQDAINTYRRAVGSWLGQMSDHSGRVRRIYVARFTVRNDVLPGGLLAYTSPFFDKAATCARISAFFEKAGKQELAAYYERLGKEYDP